MIPDFNKSANFEGCMENMFHCKLFYMLYVSISSGELISYKHKIVAKLLRKTDYAENRD
jgi:hypothetical protein